MLVRPRTHSTIYPYFTHLLVGGSFGIGEGQEWICRLTANLWGCNWSVILVGQEGEKAVVLVEMMLLWERDVAKA